MYEVNINYKQLLLIVTSFSWLCELSIVLFIASIVLFIIILSLSMPHITKGKKTSLSLKKARRTKKFKVTIAAQQEREPEGILDLLTYHMIL